MLLFWLILCAVGASKADETRWVWGHRSQRAFSNDEVPKYDSNNVYDREREREPTTKRPPTGQTSQEDYLNPDDLRIYNGPSGFGFPPYGPGGPPPSNYPPGQIPHPGGNGQQGNPNNAAYPYPGPGGQPGFPGPGNGFPGGYPNNRYPNQGGYPSQGNQQGFPPTPGSYPGPLGGSGGGYPGGFGGSFGGSYGGGFQGQGGFPGPGFGGGQYRPQRYPGQGELQSQFGYPSQYPNGGAYPPTGGQFLNAQYNCAQFGTCGHLSQYPGQFPAQYPYPYPGAGFPFPNPYGPGGGNPYGVTPYSNDGGASSPSDDYEDLSKNGTDNNNSSFKAEGKAFNTNSYSQPSSVDMKVHKHKKT